MVGKPYTPPGQPNRASLPRDPTPSPTMVRNPLTQAAPDRMAAQNEYLSDVLIGVQQQAEPHDRVLELARQSPTLKARGWPSEVLDRLDLSDEGLAKIRAVLAPPKPPTTVWEMGLVQPKSRAWRPPIVPALTEEQLRVYDRTDELLGFPIGQSRRQIRQEGGGPGVRSHAGAMGRAQVMQETLDRLNQKREKEGQRPLDADSDTDAAIIHRALMQENMNHFKDSRAALAAYNGGWDPRRWNNRETQHYVEVGTLQPFPIGLGMKIQKR